MKATLRSLHGRWMTDSVETDWEVIGFESDGAVVVLSDVEGTLTRLNFQMLLQHENAQEALGDLDATDRLTCPDCICWNLRGHEDNWLEATTGMEQHLIEADEMWSIYLAAWKADA